MVLNFSWVTHLVLQIIFFLVSSNWSAYTLGFTVANLIVKLKNLKYKKILILKIKWDIFERQCQNS